MTVKPAASGAGRQGLSHIVEQESQGKPEVIGRRIMADGFTVPEGFQGVFPDIAFGVELLGVIHIIQDGEFRPVFPNKPGGLEEFQPPVRAGGNQNTRQEKPLGFGLWREAFV